MRNYIQRGDTLTVTAPYALTSGQGCQVGNIFGLSVNNQSVGDSTELVVQGVFDLAKDGSTFASGAKVYWDNTQQLATANTLTAAGVANKEIGVAVLDQPSGVAAPGGQAGDPTVRVRLNPLGFGPVQASDTDSETGQEKDEPGQRLHQPGVRVDQRLIDDAGADGDQDRKQRPVPELRAGRAAREGHVFG